MCPENTRVGNDNGEFMLDDALLPAKLSAIRCFRFMSLQCSRLLVSQIVLLLSN